MRVSHGCMRLYANDIEEFATHVPPGTPVRIINSPVKVGWKGGAMFVEVHEALEEQRTVYVPEAAVADAIHIANRVSARPVDIDWVQAAGNYVELHMGTRVLLMRSWQNILKSISKSGISHGQIISRACRHCGRLVMQKLSLM